MSAGITKMGSLAEEKEKKPVKSRRKDTMNALFKTPLVRQYLHKGIMYREAEPRDPSRFELFFDLLYVGIIRQFAHIPEYNYNGTNLAVFVSDTESSRNLRLCFTDCTILWSLVNMARNAEFHQHSWNGRFRAASSYPAHYDPPCWLYG